MGTERVPFFGFRDLIDRFAKLYKLISLTYHFVFAKFTAYDRGYALVVIIILYPVKRFCVLGLIISKERILQSVGLDKNQSIVVVKLTYIVICN